ncbi:MAG: phosphate propanoyltransferase [Patescibacteria group bacterium]
MKIPLEVSARHCHLSQSDLDILFGKNYKLQKIKDLSQPGQFAAVQTVTILGPKGKIERVRVLGPLRSKTQVEISKTDGFILGVLPPLRISGDLVGSAGIRILGPKSEINLKEGLIVAWRHLHCSPQEAKNLGIKNSDLISVKAEGERGLVFANIVVRVDKNFRLACQLDTDEANAAGVRQGDFGILIK